MLVRAVKSFGGLGPHGRIHVSSGQVFELPEGVDWLKAGLVVPVEGQPESAMLAPAQPKHVGVGKKLAWTVPGVGAAAAELLSGIGIETVADLAASSENELIQLDGVGKATARKWLKAARELLRG